MCDEHTALRSQYDDKTNQVFEIQDQLIDMESELGTFFIPNNILTREHQLESYSEKVERINHEFNDAKAADEAYEGDAISEKTISDLIFKIQPLLAEAEDQKFAHNEFLTNILQQYSKDEMKIPESQKIVKEVREFRYRINDSLLKLKDIELLLKQLNTELFKQDVINASELLRKTNSRLRERLQKAKLSLDQIVQCGDDMDGNTTNIDEEEFITELRTGLPEINKNFSKNFDQIELINSLIQQMIEKKSQEKRDEANV